MTAHDDAVVGCALGVVTGVLLHLLAGVAVLVWWLLWG